MWIPTPKDHSKIFDTSISLHYQICSFEKLKIKMCLVFAKAGIYSVQNLQGIIDIICIFLSITNSLETDMSITITTAEVI